MPLTLSSPPTLAALQACTMPPVPAHVLSWQGNPVVVDVALPQGYAAQRTKLACHSNQYIGLVRFEVARLLGCAPNKVRMFAFGESHESQGLVHSGQWLCMARLP